MIEDIAKTIKTIGHFAGRIKNFTKDQAEHKEHADELVRRMATISLLMQDVMTIKHMAEKPTILNTLVSLEKLMKKCDEKFCKKVDSNLKKITIKTKKYTERYEEYVRKFDSVIVVLNAILSAGVLTEQQEKTESYRGLYYKLLEENALLRAKLEQFTLEKKDPNLLYEEGCQALDDKKFDLALKLFTVAAEKGHMKSQTELGLLYLNGPEGTIKDISKAVQWFSAASLTRYNRYKKPVPGHYKSKYYLGCLLCMGYEKDIGETKKNPQRGLKLIQEALEMIRADPDDDRQDFYKDGLDQYEIFKKQYGEDSKLELDKKDKAIKKSIFKFDSN